MRCKGCDKFLQKPVTRKINGEYVKDWDLCSRCHGAGFSRFVYTRDHEYIHSGVKQGVTSPVKVD